MLRRKLIIVRKLLFRLIRSRFGFGVFGVVVNPVGDAGAVAELADLFRREASGLGGLVGDALRHFESTEWVGRRSVLCGGQAARRAVVMERHRGELLSLASDLDAHAEWIRETIRELEGLERRIRVWADANPPMPEVPGPDASLITWWPSYCSFDWRVLARRLWAAGAYF